ncbi:MAG: hypothetical protein IKC35_01680 [Clostridia bacterium]|nr:hypothetical protein [Clostridia bacterium]
MKNKFNGRNYAALNLKLKKEREKGKMLAEKLSQMSDNETLFELAQANEYVKNRIIAQYLYELTTRNSPNLASNGLSALTPVNKPKNLADAKRLAEKIIRY